MARKTKKNKPKSKGKGKGKPYKHPIPSPNDLIDFLEDVGKPIKVGKILDAYGLKGQRMRTLMLDRLYDNGGVVVDRVIDVHMGKLRQKLEPDPSTPQFLLTV